MISVAFSLDLSQRVNSVKEENKKLKTENDVRVLIYVCVCV